MPRWSLLLLSLLLLHLAPAARAEGPVDAVTLPLARWQQMMEELEAAAVRAEAPVAVLQVDRSVVGSFRKGVLSATLDSRFEIAAQGHVRVPVLDADTSIRRVLLDGKETSLLREGDMYTVGVDAPGPHRVEVAFVQGHEDDRFARRLSFRLPPSGPTRLDVQVSETDIDASLTQGAITALRAEGGGTRITGHLDGRGTVDLSWKRRVTHASTAADARTEARVDALFTLHEALVRGVAVVDMTVREGETDRLDLVVPADIEVVDVTGDAVLQWRTDAAADGTGRLSVLLRYLVDDQARVEVQFQFPVDLAQQGPVALRLPRPADDVPTEGAIGVQGPAGLQVEVASTGGAEALTLRDLPPELTELTQSPLLLGFRFASNPAQAVPEIGLTLTRTEEVELTSTIVDDLQASSVLLEDGTEITKLRLRLRNNTRQYLAATLPAGAVLTHAFIDGQGLRPALADPARPEALLLPLRQSERLEGGQALTYVVQPGDTLTGIAAAYLSSSNRWAEILAANSDQLANAWDLEPGQVLRIPSTNAGSLQESSFVIELAYKVPGKGLGALGRRAVVLPALDVDTVAITWHLYLPDALEPLRFQANLTQTSQLRYDAFRRFQQFLKGAFWMRSAWAGGDYSSILSQRKAIYREENMRRQGGQELTSSFPYVGRRTAFARILSGREQPRIAVMYVDRDVLPVLRVGALLAGFGLLTWVLRAPGERRRLLWAAAGLALTLVLAHLVLGMHRRLLWGLDLALILDLLRLHGGAMLGALGRRLRSPSALLDALSWRNLASLVTVAVGLLWLGTFPLLLSCTAFVLLVILRRVL